MKRPLGFSKSERIRRSFDYKTVFKKGTSFRDGVFALTIYRDARKHHRLGLSIGSAKIPLASRRNRVKRIIREVFRHNKAKLKNGPYDIAVWVTKEPTFKINYSTVEKRIQALLKRSNAL